MTYNDLFLSTCACNTLSRKNYWAAPRAVDSSGKTDATLDFLGLQTSEGYKQSTWRPQTESCVSVKEGQSGWLRRVWKASSVEEYGRGSVTCEWEGTRKQEVLQGVRVGLAIGKTDVN